MPASRLRRRLGAALLLAAVIVPSQSAGAENPTSDPPTFDPPIGDLPAHESTTEPSGSDLLAPVPCGVEIQGTTYPGHGSHDWNLDLNTTGGASRDDVGLPILAQGDGTVVWFKTSGYNRGAGTYIEVDYGAVTVRYVHLVEGSIPDERREIGAAVRAGDQLGELGDTGHVTGPHLHLEYWDSTDHDDTAWYQLPRANHIPVAFEGVAMVATVGTPSPVVVSTNCPEPTPEELRRELRLRRWA